MSFLNDFSLGRIQFAYRASISAYENDADWLANDGYRILSIRELGMTSAPLGGDVFINETNRGAAILYTNGDKIVLVFRGTDDASDFNDYPDMLTKFTYISSFFPLFDAIQAAGLKIDLVTGHSLGGGAANKLIDLLQAFPSIYSSFSDSQLITFESPYISRHSSNEALNFGFMSDLVYGLAGGLRRAPLETVTLSIYRVSDADVVPFPVPFPSLANHGKLDGYAALTSLFQADKEFSEYVDLESNALVHSITPRTQVVFDGKVDPWTLQSYTLRKQPTIIVGEDKYHSKDHITSGFKSDTVFGLAGEDTLIGSWGDDILFGSLGSDSLIGGRDRDTLLGGAESDTLVGGGGDDVLDGGAGNNVLLGGDGKDLLYADMDSFLFGLDYEFNGGPDKDSIYIDELNTLSIYFPHRSIELNNIEVVILTATDSFYAELEFHGTGAATIETASSGRTLIYKHNGINLHLGGEYNEVFLSPRKTNTIWCGDGVDDINLDFRSASKKSTTIIHDFDYKIDNIFSDRANVVNKLIDALPSKYVIGRLGYVSYGLDTFYVKSTGRLVTVNLETNDNGGYKMDIVKTHGIIRGLDEYTVKNWFFEHDGTLYDRGFWNEDDFL